MKRLMRCVTAAALIMMFLSSTALAGAPQLSDSLFSSAKSALVELGSQAYEDLVYSLPFASDSPSADEWQRFAENFSTLSASPQTTYAVAYWNGRQWLVAVPVRTPSSGDVEVFILTSADGSTFEGYRYARWSSVQSEYQQAEYVVWNSEYADGEASVAAD